MWWILFPVVSSVFYCFGSYVQNYLTDIALPKKRGGSLAIMHSIGFFASLVLLMMLFGRAVFMVPLGNAVGLMIAGAINVLGATFYYRAIQKGDNIDVAIFSQIAPLISLGLGVLMLGETITANQGLGFLFIMAAALLVVFGTNNKKRSPDFGVAIITIVYCFFSILSDMVYALYLTEGVAPYIVLAQAFFFFQLGSLLSVIMCFIFLKSWRKAVTRTFFTGKKHRVHFFAMLVDNLMLVLGEILYKFGLIIAPVVALVSPIGRVSTLFASLFIMLIVGRIFPKFIHAKRVTKKIILCYLIAAILIIVGIVMMN